MKCICIDDLNKYVKNKKYNYQEVYNGYIVYSDLKDNDWLPVLSKKTFKKNFFILDEYRNKLLNEILL